jgi:hypothetical protein
MPDLLEFSYLHHGLLACILFLCVPMRRRSWRTFFALSTLLFALAGGVLACGGSGGGGGGGNSGTTSGAYSISVTVTSGSVSTTSTVALTVP